MDDGSDLGPMALTVRPRKGTGAVSIAKGASAKAAQRFIEPKTVEFGPKGFGIRALDMVKAPAAFTEAEAAEIAPLFPEVDPGILPMGSNILVQIMSEMEKIGSLYLADETKDRVKWNEMTARVIALGPLAYRNPNTGEAFAEGDWCKPGDFIRIPKYGGDRSEVALPSGSKALFILVKDREVISKITGNPLTYRMRG